MSTPRFNLSIDRGNSSVKAALHCGSASAAPVAVATEACLEIALERVLAMAGASDVHIASVIFSSVGEQAESEAAADKLRLRFPRVTVLSHATPAPLHIHYGTPETLGVDRLAAAVGAATVMPHRDLLVVDAGSAVTYDLVSAEGVFLGGNIAPGVEMRLRAMHEFTARLPRVKLHSSHLPASILGQSTHSAMANGALLGVVSEILFYSDRTSAATTILTGGYARDLSSIMDTLCHNTEIHTMPDLVSIGLNSILLFNETK